MSIAAHRLTLVGTATGGEIHGYRERVTDTLSSMASNPNTFFGQNGSRGDGTAAAEILQDQLTVLKFQINADSTLTVSEEPARQALVRAVDEQLARLSPAVRCR